MPIPMDITFEPLIPKMVPLYCEVGMQSYQEHYVQLWENGDPYPFYEENLTVKAVSEGLKNPKQFFYIIHSQKVPIGVLKLSLDVPFGKEVPLENILINKIYLLKAHTGKGLGNKCLLFAEQFAKDHHRKCIWLYTMKKGRAKQFYLKHGYIIFGESEVTFPGILEEEKEMWVMKKLP